MILFDRKSLRSVASIFAVITLLWLSPPTRAEAASEPSSGGFERHLQQFWGLANVAGIQVVALPSGNVVWEYRADDPLLTASLMKVMTSYSALKKLGPYYHFKTSVWASRAPRNGVIEGDVWLKGEGDPFFITEKAWWLAQRIYSLGIRRIEGSVWVDNGYFSPSTQQICLDGRCDSPYNPVVSATALEFNSIVYNLLPGLAAGEPASVEIFPPGGYARVRNEAITGKPGSQAPIWIRSSGIIEQGDSPGENFHVGGHVPLRLRMGAEHRLNVHSPAAFAAHVFKTLLEQSGVKVVGGVGGEGTVHKRAFRLTDYESPPLCDLLYGLNRFSNNFMAEMLFRVVGAEAGGEPGTAEKGSLAVRTIISRLGVPPEEIDVDGGSGLSRSCRVSARAFCRVLVDAYNDFGINAEFLSSLARNGREGTLRRRLQTAKPGIQVRGKTGTLRDVISFAGYVSGPDGDTYAAAVILNQVNQTGAARAAIDRMLAAIPDLADEVKASGGFTPPRLQKLPVRQVIMERKPHVEQIRGTAKKK